MWEVTVLSERDHGLLAEIERRLCADDPVLARLFTGGVGTGGHRRVDSVRPAISTQRRWPYVAAVVVPLLLLIVSAFLANPLMLLGCMVALVCGLIAQVGAPYWLEGELSPP
jgi:hypothetical protein